MADDSSGDEFANYDPTTPARPATTKKTTMRPARLPTKPAAGPSSRPAPASKAAPKRTNGHAKTAKPSEQIVIDSSSEAEPKNDQLNGSGDVAVTAAAPPKTVTKKGPPGRASDASAATKAKPSAAKGKARADMLHVAKPTIRSAAREDEVMDIDDETNDDEGLSRKRVRSGPPARPVKVNANAGPSRSTKEQEAVVQESTRLARDNEDLRKEIETLKYERDQYSKQVQEALQIRTTEPEQALQEHIALHESLMKNQQLWQQMANATSASDNSQIPHFLSREAVDAEKEMSEREVKRLTDVSRQKDAQLTEKDKRIAELEAEAKHLRLELEQEIARAKTLVARPQPNLAARTYLKADGDVKNAAKVTSLYEDMTNLLVCGAKQEKNQLYGKDEWVFNCIYTHGQQQTDGENPSLNFLLREIWERTEGGADGEFIRKCKYSPQTQTALPDWFGRLEFFKEPFLFSWDQLTVFLRTLTDKVASAVNPDGEDDADEEQANVEKEVIMID